ncbi:MAG: cation:proton antiporter, partial [Candidatus Micrarchaeota archaeon]
MNELFFILGLTILTGFLSTIISERTRVSQVLLLMLFGFLLGPASGIVDASEDSVIVSLLPFLSTLALIVLLFDGGMSFDMFSLARAIPRSTAFSVATFLSGAIFIGLAAALMLGWPPIHGLLLGTVLGGTSSAIVIAMAERTGVSKETKSLLAVESTLTDAFCIIMAVIVINLIQADRLPEAGDFIHNLLSSFTLAMVVGAFSALAWMFLVSRFKVQKYSYMLTLALVFGLFAFTDAIRGNGGFAVFVFGLMLGNAEELDKYLKWKIHRPIGRAIKIFQEEMTFFVRTFFFVYMGLLLAPSYFGFHVLAVSVVVLALIAASRLLSKRLL